MTGRYLSALIAIVAAGLVWAPLAHGDPDSPLQAPNAELFLADMAFTDDQGEWETSLTGDMLRQGDTTTLDVTPEVEHGITDWLTLAAELPLTRVSTDGDASTGPGDADVTMQATLFQARRMAAGALVTVTAPTGDSDRGLGDGQWQVRTAAVTSLLAVHRLQTHVGLGLQFSSDGVVADTTVALTLDLGALGATLELVGEVADGAVAAQVAAGLFHRFDERFEVGLGLPIGVAGDVSDWGVLALAVITP